MNLTQMKTEQLALVLHGLRCIYVEESELTRLDMIGKIEAALSARGKRLPQRG